MAFNFLIIGLGSTGCDVIREVKKKLYVEWRSKEHAGMFPTICTFTDALGNRSRIATLSIDSNVNRLNGEDHEWMVFGRRLKLEANERVELSHVGAHTILTNLGNYPNVKPWMQEEINFAGNMLRGADGLPGCNQIRRLGRLSLVSGSGIGLIMDGITNQFNALTLGGTPDTEFHIFCTLAGGTGSGAVVDVIAQLQLFLRHQPGNHKVRVHAFVTNINTSANTGNFYANQYAALTELNAFKRGIYMPWDIQVATEQRSARFPNGGIGTYEAVSLITDSTGAVNVPFAQQVENAAELIFQLAVRQGGNLPLELERGLSSEDFVPLADEILPNGNFGERSVKFSAYGVRRWAIPEREIREKLSYSFARQYLLAILYNDWNGRFQDNPGKSFAVDNVVRQRLAAWHLDLDHNWLSRVEPIDGNDVQTPTFLDFWQRRLMAVENRVLEPTEQVAQDQWLAKFDEWAEQLWNTRFRDGNGVCSYFQTQLRPDNLSSRAKRLRMGLEAELLGYCETMGDGQRPFLNVLENMVGVVIDEVEKSREIFAKTLLATGDESAKVQYKEASNEMNHNKSEFRNAGIWFTNRTRKRILNEYRLSATKYYRYKTREEAAKYGVAFCAELLKELGMLKLDVRRFTTNIGLILRKFTNEFEARINAANNAANGDEGQFRDAIYLFDANQINQSIAKDFEGSKAIQDASVWNIIQDVLSVRPETVKTFNAYLENIRIDDHGNISGNFVNTLLQSAEQRAVQQHNFLVAHDTTFAQTPLLKQNIVYKLFQQYAGNIDGNLGRDLQDFINKSKPMIAFDPTQSFTVSGTNGPRQKLCIFLPLCAQTAIDPAFAQFRLDLRTTLLNMAGGGHIRTIIDVPESINSTDLTIISIAHFFPARCARTVQGLKNRYDDLLNGNNPQVVASKLFEIYTEKHTPPLPDLMKPTIQELRERNFALALLATAMGLMVLPKNNVNGSVSFGNTNAAGMLLPGGVHNSGMSVDQNLRTIAEGKVEQYGETITMEVAVLYHRYFGHADHNNFHILHTLVAGEFALVHHDTEARDTKLAKIQERLSAITAESYHLANRNNNDPQFLLFCETEQKARALAHWFCH